MEDEEEIGMAPKKPDDPEPGRRKHHTIFIPRRKPSVVKPPRKVVYITPDKTTCVKCPCFPKDDPYAKPKKLNPCQKSPLTLYELAMVVVDGLKFPEAYSWTEKEVAEWMGDVVGLPEYKACIYDNYINGRRLLFLEDPSHMPMINVHCFEHIKMITAKIRQLFTTEFILFARSVGLPPRKPLTHCTWFKSRTGPTWGIRQNWRRGDILRWMKIILPEPVYRDHWDLVWYQKPDFPKFMFGRIRPSSTHEHIPHYKPAKHDPCPEYLVPRKFRLKKHLPDQKQMIWMEHRPGSPLPKETELARQRKEALKWSYKPTIPKESRLDPKRISLTGLAGKDLILARRLMPKKKFLAFE